MSANIQTCDCISLATTQLILGDAVLLLPSCDFLLALNHNQTEVVLKKKLARIKNPFFKTNIPNIPVKSSFLCDLWKSFSLCANLVFVC